jgi:hypothetical protein
LKQNQRQPVSQNAFYSKRAFRNQEINASFDPDLSEADKSEYSKLMKQYGDMPMSKVPMKTRMRIRELGRKVRGDKSVSGLRASDLVDDMKRRQMGEAKAEYEVKYSSSKRGPIKVTKFMSQDQAQAFLKKIRGEGMNGIVSKGGKPVRTPMKEDAKSDRLEKIARAAAAREKDQAKQKEAAKQKHYAASAKSREAVKYLGNKDQFGRPKNEEVEQTDESLRQRADDSMTFGNRQAAFSAAFKKKHGRAPTKQELRDAGVGKGGDNPAGAKAYQKAISKLRPASRSGIKDKFVHGEEVEVAEAVDGWIAMYNGKKVEIKKSEAKDLYAAKLKAIQMLKVPKSKQGLLAIKPAVNEEVEQVDEAKRGAIASAARKGMPPYTIVAIQGLNPPKVVAQETTMIASAVPAHVKEMNSKYPKAKISVEGKSGKILYTEQVEESMIGRTKPSRELNVQKFEKKYLGTKSLKDAKRAAHKAERKKEKMDVKINPIVDENVDAAKERVAQAKQRVMVAKQRLARTKARDYGNKVRGMRSEEIKPATPMKDSSRQVVQTTAGRFQQKTLAKKAEQAAARAGQTQSRTTELAKRIRRQMKRKLRRPTMNR